MVLRRRMSRLTRATVKLVAGERDPVVLAGLARGVLRNKTEDLRLALAGRFTTHHGQMVALHLTRIDHLDQIQFQQMSHNTCHTRLRQHKDERNRLERNFAVTEAEHFNALWRQAS